MHEVEVTTLVMFLQRELLLDDFQASETSGKSTLKSAVLRRPNGRQLLRSLHSNSMNDPGASSDILDY